MSHSIPRSTPLPGKLFFYFFLFLGSPCYIIYISSSKSTLANKPNISISAKKKGEYKPQLSSKKKKFSSSHDLSLTILYFYSMMGAFDKIGKEGGEKH